MNAHPKIISSFIAAATLIGGSALAQQDMFVDFNHPNVMIDLSVIDDSGYTRPQGGPMLADPSGRNLLVPQHKSPMSTLHVAPAAGGKFKLVAPTAAPVKKAKAVTAPVVKKVAAPAAPRVAKPAPVKITAAPAKKADVAEVASAPKKLQSPSEAATKTAPPPPVVKKAPVVKTVTAPKVEIPVPAPEIKKEPAQQASLPPAGGDLQAGNVLRVSFAADATKLPAAFKDDLVALAAKLAGKDNLRLQLMAYAGGEGLSASLARRMSLSRALSVRSFLIEKGVRSTRIDVRALGNKTTEEPLNRVDLNVAER